MVLVFSSSIVVQGHDIGIVFYILRQPAPAHGIRASVYVHDHVGDEVDLPTGVWSAKIGIVGDV